MGKQKYAVKIKDLPLKYRPAETKEEFEKKINQKHLSKVNRMEKVYGVNIQDFHNLLIWQHGVCAICGREAKKAKSRHGQLVIDHDHKTGRVRGLLCSNCNVALGLFQENIDVLLSAQTYLLDSCDKLTEVYHAVL